MARTIKNASTGYELRAHYIPDEQRHAVTAARVLVAASIDPKVRLSVPDLAKATGLSEDAVAELLRSDTYKELLIGTCKQRIAGVLGKSINVLDRAIGNEDAKMDTRLEAIRCATTMYRTLNQVNEGHTQAQSLAAVDQLMKHMDAVAMNRLNGNALTPPLPSDPAPAAAVE